MKIQNSVSSYLHSNHSLIRSSQRGISNEVIDTVVTYGLLIKKQGCNFYLGIKKKFPSTLDHKLAEKSSNVLVLIKENVIVTCYKHENIIKEVKRKSQRNLKPTSNCD